MGGHSPVKRKNWRIRRDTIHGLMLVYIAQLLPHFNHLPLWLCVFLVGLGGLRLVIHHGWLPFPSKKMLTLIVVIANVAFFADYRMNFSVEMAVAFLLLGVGFKFLEIQKKRDCFLFVFTLLYLSATAFLFDQDIVTVIYQLVCVLGAFGVLMTMHVEAKRTRWRHMFGQLAKTGVITLPLVTMLFIFFPRMSPLWSIPLKNGSAISGISNSMTPGDIADLAQSSERAFRVSFTGDMPPRRDLYWRGIILDHFDGSTWTATEQLPSSFGKKIETAYSKKPGENSYRVLLEPSYQRWGFSLAGSLAESSNIRLNENNLVRFSTEVAQATRYQMSLSPVNRAVMPVSLSDLQLPVSGNSRAKEWIKTLRKQVSSPEELIARVMRYFREEPFYYSLKPPPTGKDFVDDFLFETRKGFCSHYAGSLAFLLRQVKIPARVVVGYQGGELNRDNNYLIVHQYDAHAWVEAWLDGQGWVRLDPTAMVAPSRIESGLQQAVAEEGSFLSGSLLSPARYNSIPLVRWMRWKLDALNYQWQKWVVGYDADTQSGFIRKLLGDVQSSTVIVVLIISAGIFFGVWIWLIGREHNKVSHSVAVKEYLKCCHKLEKYQLERYKGESPGQYLSRIKRVLGKSPLRDSVKRKIVTELQQVTRNLIVHEYAVSKEDS